jgi:hypothetical protein
MMNQNIVINLPTLHGALSAETEELILEASVNADEDLKILFLCFEPKKFLLLPPFKEESDEELGDCDFCLLLMLLVLRGFQTIVTK